MQSFLGAKLETFLDTKKAQPIGWAFKSRVFNIHQENNKDPKIVKLNLGISLAKEPRSEANEVRGTKCLCWSDSTVVPPLVAKPKAKRRAIRHEMPHPVKGGLLKSPSLYIRVGKAKNSHTMFDLRKRDPVLV